MKKLLLNLGCLLVAFGSMEASAKFRSAGHYKKEFAYEGDLEKLLMQFGKRDASLDPATYVNLLKTSSRTDFLCRRSQTGNRQSECKIRFIPLGGGKPTFITINSQETGKAFGAFCKALYETKGLSSGSCEGNWAGEVQPFSIVYNQRDKKSYIYRGMNTSLQGGVHNTVAEDFEAAGLPEFDEKSYDWGYLDPAKKYLLPPESFGAKIFDKEGKDTTDEHYKEVWDHGKAQEK